jgi:hypothetical protein
MSTYDYFVLFGLAQLLHSQEEIWTGFHKRWFVFKMPIWVFITFEILFSIPIILYMAIPSLPFAEGYMKLFALLMLINGIEHLVWALVEKKYVPGLYTSPLFLVIFVFYYFTIL